MVPAGDCLDCLVTRDLTVTFTRLWVIQHQLILDVLEPESVSHWNQVMLFRVKMCVCESECYISEQQHYLMHRK